MRNGLIETSFLSNWQLDSQFRLTTFPSICRFDTFDFVQIASPLDHLPTKLRPLNFPNVSRQGLTLSFGFTTPPFASPHRPRN